jgi:hypothetical protein
VRKCLGIWRVLTKRNSKRQAARDEPKSGVGGWPDFGFPSHIATPVLNRMAHISTAERLDIELCKTDLSLRCINLLPKPFIEKYLIRIFCSDLLILIFNRPEKSDDETMNVSIY